MFDIKANYNDAVASRKSRTHNCVDNLSIVAGLFQYFSRLSNLIYMHKNSKKKSVNE